MSLSPRSSYILIILAALGYAVYFMIQAPISYDEAWSWDGVRTSSLHGIIFYDEFIWVNNHLLNSLWIAFMDNFLPDNLIGMRILSLLFMPFYAWALYLFFSDLKNKYIQPIVLLVLLCSECYLMYFFKARGYSHAITFEVGSMLFAYWFVKDQSRVYLMLSLFTGVLSALANFGLMYYLTALCIVLVLYQLWIYREVILKLDFKTFLSRGIFVPELLVLLFTLFYLYPICMKVSQPGKEFFPGATNILSSMASAFTLLVGIDTYPPSIRIVLKLALGACVIAGIVVPAWYLIRRKHRNDIRITVIAAIIIAEVLLMHVLYVLTDTAFPAGRAILFLTVQFIIYFFLVLDVYFPPRFIKYLLPIVVVILLNVCLNNIRLANVFYEEGVREIMLVVKNEIDENKKDLVLLREGAGVHWSYYRDTFGMDNLSIVGFDKVLDLEKTKSAHYMYLSKAHSEMAVKSNNSISKIAEFYDGEYSLLKNQAL